MKVFQKILLLVCTLIMFLLPACNKNGDTVIKSIELNAKKIELYIGEDFSLKANIKGLSWVSEDETIAKVDSKGRVSALSIGETTVSAERSGVRAECSVVVKERPVVSTETVSFSETTVFVGVNENKTLNISVYKNGELTNEKASLLSSNEAVATISSDGNILGKSEGVATITATYGSAQATCTIYVSNGDADFSIDQASFTMSVGENLNIQNYISAVGSLEDLRPVWNASNLNITVSDSGMVYAAMPGESVVQITCQGRTIYCCIKVYQEKFISSVNDFVTIENNQYVNYKLSKDLDFTNYNWENKNIVGELSSTLDGNGHKIYNVRRSMATDRAGLFGKITETGSIVNLAVYIEEFLYKDNCGALALYNYGKIENSYVKISANAHTTAAAELLRSGVVYENYGLMNCLLVDVTAKSGGVSTVTFHAFAARNFGIIRNGLTISSASATRTVDDVSCIYYHLLSGSSDMSHYNGYGYLNVNSVDNSYDKRRENCYIFLSEAQLRTLGNGGVAIDGSKGIVAKTETGTLQVSSREILVGFSSDVWTFNQGQIGLFGLILYKG